MNQTIQIYSRSVYGRSLLYVANPEQANSLAKLTNTRTLEPRHVMALEELGFTFVSVPDPKIAWYAPANAQLLGH